MKIFYLEMLSPGALRPKHTSDPDFRVLETAVPQPPFNKYLYALVGRDWHWTDKLRWTDEQWQEYVTDPNLRTWVAYKKGTPAGYFELQKQDGDNIEIAYFGLAPNFIGQGFGGALLTEAITQAWAWGASRVWVHTCSLDHPGALTNYQARGFALYDVVEMQRGDGRPLVSDVDADVIDFLTGLGFSIVEAQSALQRLPREAKTVEERVQLALQYLDQG